MDTQKDIDMANCYMKLKKARRALNDFMDRGEAEKAEAQEEIIQQLLDELEEIKSRP